MLLILWHAEHCAIAALPQSAAAYFRFVTAIVQCAEGLAQECFIVYLSHLLRPVHNMTQGPTLHCILFTQGNARIDSDPTLALLCVAFCIWLRKVENSWIFSCHATSTQCTTCALALYCEPAFTCQYRKQLGAGWNASNNIKANCLNTWLSIGVGGAYVHQVCGKYIASLQPLSVTF